MPYWIWNIWSNYSREMLKGIRVERLYVVLKRTFEFGSTPTSIEAIWLMKTNIIAVLFRSVKIINVFFRNHSFHTISSSKVQLKSQLNNNLTNMLNMRIMVKSFKNKYYIYKVKKVVVLQIQNNRHDFDYGDNEKESI